MTAISAAITVTSPEVVVDTDVVSFLFKEDSRGARYRPHLNGRLTIISAETLAELYHWPERSNWGQRRRGDLELFLDGYHVQYPDRETCRLYAILTAAARRAGYVVPSMDAWQAATALRLGVPLVTHNARNYQGIPNLLVLTEQVP